MPLYETENITCVEPADYPASRVSWTNDNAQVRILGGSTGAIDPNCVGDLLAHEIGHALGLEDIYGDSWDNPFGRKSLQRVVAHGCVSSEQFKKAQDWNGGSGARYYAYSFPRAYLIPRLLMCGSSLLAGSVDLPLSSVKGVGAVTENASFFQDVMCPVGCEDIFESQYAKEDEDE